MRGQGFLAIWSDIEDERETDYLHWLMREHTAERLAIPGFLAVRVFRALREDVRRFFFLYELETANVVDSPAYLARLDQPTPWTRRIMPVLGNFVRGGGRLLASAGTGQGGNVMALRLRAPPEAETRCILTDLVTADRITAARLLVTDGAKTSIPTNEKSIREKDRSFEALLLIEGADALSLQAAAARLARGSLGFADLAADTAHAYTQVFGLSRELLLRNSGPA